MSIVADTLNRLQSARRKGPSSRPPIQRGSSINTDYTDLPHSVSKQSGSRMIFSVVSLGVTLLLSIIGFGMFWVGIQVGPKAQTPSRPLLMPKALSESVKSPTRLHSTPASTEIPAPISGSSRVVPQKVLATQQSMVDGEPPSAALIESSSLSKPGQPIAQGLASNGRPQPSDVSGPSPKHNKHGQKQKSDRQTTTPQVLTTNDSFPLAQSSPAQKESSLASPVKLTLDKDRRWPKRKPVHSQKPLNPKASSSKFKSPLSLEEKLAQGRSLVKQYRYLEAVDILQPLFVTLPEEWEPWFWMGTAHMGLGRYEEAREFFREGLARDETIPQLWVQRAIVEHQRGKFSQSLDALRHAELLAPSLPEVQLNLAFTLENQGHTRSALEHYRQYLSLTDHNPLHLSTREKVLDRILHLGKSEPD